MRNAVFAALSLAVAIAALFLALRPDEEPPEAPSASPTRAPDTTPAVPTFAAATATPSPSTTPTPSSTPSPTPSPSPPRSTPTAPQAQQSPTPTPTPAAPPPFAYRRFDATGEASQPGSYALLMPTGNATRAVTTFEELRTGSTVARFNVVDADGIARAEHYGTVAVGDLFEWRQAEDCWTRFEVTSTHAPDPSVREFGVRWMTYAFSGCSGAFAADLAATVDFGPLPDLGNPALTYPVRHGPWQFVPRGWDGAVEEVERRTPLAGSDWAPASATTLFDARQLPFWRDPAVPIGWTFGGAVIPREYGARDRYRTTYIASNGSTAILFDWYHSRTRGAIVESDCPVSCVETRVIAGRPARVLHSPPGPARSVAQRATVWVYDPETQVEYLLREHFPTRRLGGDIDKALDIARGLFEDGPAKPGALRYSRSDPVGAAETPGSHAFLSVEGDHETVANRFEQLRDGTANRLLIHTSDVYGTPHAATFNAVRAGDRFEWWRSDACWVRFKVVQVRPDPTGGTPRKLFAVQPEVAAPRGCAGTMPVNAYSSLDFGSLARVGGSSLAAPATYGPWTLVPEGSRPLPPRRQTTPSVPGRSQSADSFGSANLAEARRLPGWREPVLPARWAFGGVVGGRLSSTTVGYCATYRSAADRLAVEVCGTQATPGSSVLDASWGDGVGVREFRTMDDRPVLVTYSPPGPNHSEEFRVEVSVYDVDTDTAYTVFGYDPTLTGNNVDAVMRIARSLFERPNPP